MQPAARLPVQAGNDHMRGAVTRCWKFSTDHTNIFSMSLKLAAATLLIALAGCTPRPDVGEDVPPVASSANGQSTMPGAGISDSGIVAGSLRDLTVNVGDTVYFAYGTAKLSDPDCTTHSNQARSWEEEFAAQRSALPGHCNSVPAPLPMPQRIGSSTRGLYSYDDSRRFLMSR